MSSVDKKNKACRINRHALHEIVLVRKIIVGYCERLFSQHCCQVSEHLDRHLRRWHMMKLK